MIYVVLKTSNLRSLENVWFTTSWRRLMYVVSKTFNLRRLEDVWFTMSWRRPIYFVLKTSNFRCLEDVWFNNVLRTSDLRHPEEVRFMSSWRSPIYDVLKTSVKQRLCSSIVVTFIQRRKKWFFLILYCLKYSGKFKCFYLGYYLGMKFCKVLRFCNSVMAEVLSVDCFLHDRDVRHERINDTW